MSRALVCSIGEHAKCDGNAPNGPAGAGNPCGCDCHAAEADRGTLDYESEFAAGRAWGRREGVALWLASPEAVDLLRQAVRDCGYGPGVIFDSAFPRIVAALREDQP